MEGEMGDGDLQRMLEAIKSSQAIEDRILLVRELSSYSHSGTHDLTLVVECLATFWDESTPSGISVCMLNKEILQLTAKCLELHLPNCIIHFAILGTTVNTWCRKYLQIAVDEVERKEDQSAMFLQVTEFRCFEKQHLHIRKMTALTPCIVDLLVYWYLVSCHLEQLENLTLDPVKDNIEYSLCMHLIEIRLILDSLSISSSIILSLTRIPVGEKMPFLMVENFILEQINLIKSLIVEIKKIHSIAAAVLKVMPIILDSLVKLSRAYTEAVIHDNVEIPKDSPLMDGEGEDYFVHVININTLILKGLYELGILAASGGGNLVTILNSSWKGVVSLLRLGKWNVADRMDVGGIILTIVSLATDSLTCAVKTWSHASNENLTLSEAKRALFLVKFYLVNAVRISSEYPSEALKASIGLTNCVLLMSSLGISFSKEKNLRPASEALSEVLQPTYILLLCSILDSDKVEHEQKLQMLDKLFTDESNRNSNVHEKPGNSTSSLENLDFCGTESLSLGRMMLFLNLMKASVLLREDVVLDISKRLKYFSSSLSNEAIYSCILVLHIPVPSVSGATTCVVWHPLLPFIIHIFKTFMIVASSSVLAWAEMENFLIKNVFHPHVICIEIILELWCFMIRHAKQDMVEDALQCLCSLLITVAVIERDLSPFSALRKLAKFVSTVACCSPEATADYVYNYVLANEDLDVSSFIHEAILMEGFPMNLLSENLRNHFVQRTSNMFIRFMEVNIGRFTLLDSFQPSYPCGLPVHILSQVLNSCQINIHNLFDDNGISFLLKFTVSIIHEYQNTTENIKDEYSLLIGALLQIISNTKHLFASDEMVKIVLQLKNMFLASSAAYDKALYKSKVPLTCFMACLGDIDIHEDISSDIFSLISDLFHMLLKERHWAFIHLALTAFGCFTSCTSFTELWKFVPHDAALSFDMDTGTKESEDMFMSEFKLFLEKEASVDVSTPCKEQLDILLVEGKLLRTRVGKLNMSHCNSEACESKSVEINDKQITSKKRKLSDRMNDGISLLQSGLMTLTDVFSCDDNEGLKDKYCNHLSHLREIISHLSSLSNDRVD